MLRSTLASISMAAVAASSPPPVATGATATDLRLQDVNIIEAHVPIPEGARPLAAYTRYYSTFTAASKTGDRDFVSKAAAGHRIAIGRWLGHPSVGATLVHIVPIHDLPEVMDGG